MRFFFPEIIALKLMSGLKRDSLFLVFRSVYVHPREGIPKELITGANTRKITSPEVIRNNNNNNSNKNITMTSNLIIEPHKTHFNMI